MLSCDVCIYHVGGFRTVNRIYFKPVTALSEKLYNLISNKKFKQQYVWDSVHNILSVLWLDQVIYLSVS